MSAHCQEVLEGDFTFITSRCPRGEKTGAWMCPWSNSYRLYPASHALESDTQTHNTVYEFDTPDDRAFMSLFLRATGYKTAPVELTPRLEKLRDQIVSDYMTILGLYDALGQSQNAINSALRRQPQLFPYYQDRAFWVEPVMADLKSKLAVMGISGTGVE